MRELTVVVGGQYGSEGKGAVVGHLARHHLDERDLVIRVGGPNAGHTVHHTHPDGSVDVWKLRQIPAAAPVSDCQLAIGPGSEIDPQVLLDEIVSLGDAGHKVESRLRIHPSATLLTYEHQNAETAARLVKNIGSTGKGIGAARADRIMRHAETIGDWAQRQGGFSHLLGPAVNDLHYYTTHRHVMVEGTQGYSLGLHGEHYPYATSGDCTAIDFLAQAGVSPWSAQLDRMTVWVVARAFPIRVAGNSGPLPGETTWERLGLPVERTTVTDKVRRVGMWDHGLVRQAVAANGGHPVVRLALTMLDHRFPKIAGFTTQEQLEEHFDVLRWIEEVEENCNALVGLVGTGPATMVEIRED